MFVKIFKAQVDLKNQLYARRYFSAYKYPNNMCDDVNINVSRYLPKREKEREKERERASTCT